MNIPKNKYRGRLAQIPIYLGKCFRQFLFQNDWKFLPMSGLIAILVSVVTGANMFVTMEGTSQGAFAMTCVCMWNGFFNSIQSICRERPIIKREHRSGMHIFSYMSAHIIYQAVICVLETVIMMAVYVIGGMHFPTEPLITPWVYLDFGITLFLVTFAADIISLFISSLVQSTTTAMTLMPFLLIFQLVFSGFLFELSGPLKKLANLSIAHYGLISIASLADYNSQPSVLLWNTLFKLRSIEEVDLLVHYVEDEGLLNTILAKSGELMQEPAYAHTAENVIGCWGALIVFAIIFAVLADFALSFVDKDHR